MLSNAGQIWTYLAKNPETIIIHDRFINFQPKQVFMKEEKSGQFMEVFLNIPTVGEIPEIQDNYSRPFVHYFKRYGAFFSLQSSQLEIWTARNLAKAGHISSVKPPCLGLAQAYLAQIQQSQVMESGFTAYTPSRR